MPDHDRPSFADMLASTRNQRSGRQSDADDLPKVSRSFASVKEQDCESGYAEEDCDSMIYEGDQAAFVDDEIACQPCYNAAQEVRDDFFER